jgi:protoporphyrinogen oxidase
MNYIDTLILGGGIAGLSLASFLDKPCVVLEKEPTFGGLSRSFNMNGVCYDIGPHIIFSKNKEVLDLHTSLVQTNRIRRSNQIFYKGRYIKYPFENDLYALDKEDREYCLKEFLHNPYETYDAQNMLQFFLKTFGEGITRTYLQPYNEKIWKYDPSCMDTQMVERIPKPPREDVIKSAEGISTEGYTHQLYFHYPKQAGFQALVDAYAAKAISRSHRLKANAGVSKITSKDGKWLVESTVGTYTVRRLINTMPIHELSQLMVMPDHVTTSLLQLKYNSIYIVNVQVKRDSIGDHFAIYLPEKDIIFHRLSKLNFLGDAYCQTNGGSTLMAEVTFRPGSYLAGIGEKEISRRVLEDLETIGFISGVDVTDVQVRHEKYAYVIYDLKHRMNTDTILSFLRAQGIYSVGRFAEFEYLNTDGVVERTLRLAAQLNQE